MSTEPTSTELLGAIMDLHAAVSHGFTSIDARFARVDAEFAELKTAFRDEIRGVHTRLTSVEGEIRGIHHWMARTDQRLSAT